jgi:UDP-N-acetylmuramate: L-alanyl-gamma-D-glutamyl-meso-diaminopimelate ligase
MVERLSEKDNQNPEPALGPEAVVYLVGICGTGMASLAGMFHQSGYQVRGSDQAVYPPMSDFLEELGIQVAKGYDARNLDPLPDVAIVGNVIRRANPEAALLERSGVPCLSMPAALNRYFLNGKTRIVVAGTHGKTTLSAMIAWILFREGLDPGFMIGGLPKNFRKNHRLGRGPFFVIEGDEYDTAYFDKRPKFLHYRPDIGIMTSCEFDHADIYQDIEHIESQFRAFAKLVPRGGRLIACGDDPRVRSIAADSGLDVCLYGLGPDVEWSAAPVEEGPAGIRVKISQGLRQLAEGTLPVFGLHNVSNAVAAISVAESVGIPPQRALDALGSFEGVRRRQEILGEERGILVIDDFAHHPTAVEATASAVRSRFPTRRLVAVFEPRTNTSRRSFFQQRYVSALLPADLAVIRHPRDVQHIPESERFDSERLAADLRALGKSALAFEFTDGIVSFLSGHLKSDDVVLIMSNGNFDNIGRRLLEMLRGPEP